MPRDFDPSVRDRTAAPTRRGGRRDVEADDPARHADPDPVPPAGSRVARDEHRPRRGTLPDRRMLRRDPPVDYPAEFGEPEPADGSAPPELSSGQLELTTGDAAPALPAAAVSPVSELPSGSGLSGPVEAAVPAVVPDAGGAAETTIGWNVPGDPAAEHEAQRLSELDRASAAAAEAARALDVAFLEHGETAPTGGPAAGGEHVIGSGTAESAPSRDSAPVKRRRPALPALEPDDPTAAAAPSRGEELSSSDALREAAGSWSTAIGEPATTHTEHGERALEVRTERSRGSQRTEGERMDGKRSRGEGDPRRGDTGLRERRGEPGEPEPRRGESGRRAARAAEAGVREPRREPEQRPARGESGVRGEATGRERRRPVDPEREARRGKTAEGRGRATDPERGNDGGRRTASGRARPVRPEGEESSRSRRGRGGDTTRGSERKGKSERGSRRAAPESAAANVGTRKTPKKKQSGPKLLDDATRAKLEITAREGNGPRAAIATFRLHTDELRRRNFAARAERQEYGNFDEFDRTTAQLTDRGYIGPGGGRMNVVGRPVEYRATTAQVAGLWPWSVGAGAPLIGTPLGSHLHTGAPVCFDPMNWFMRGSFITAPSLFVLGLNGFGKSSLVRRIVLGGVAQGITPLILADVKPDYRKLVELVGGQVIDLGYGHGKLNPLAAGVLGTIVPMLEGLPELQTQVVQEMRARQVTLVAGLVELVRGARVRDFEETLISTALSILYREGSQFGPEQPPILEDLLEVVVSGGDTLQLDAGADNPEEYHEAIKGLRRSLRALTQGPFGAIFNGHTTTPIDTTATAVCIDVSHIPNGDRKLKAAVMLACWADGFASVEAAHVLADAKMGPQRYFQVVMDELWQVLGLGDFMVDRVDELTRLQRGIATSLIMISHTIKDLQALGSEAAIAKALGFLERARAKIFGALPAEEISRLDSTVPFTSAEEEMVTSWSAPQALTGEALKPGQQRPPAPGTGKFLLKIGEDRRPGIPFHMEFTISERESGIHDTNQRFSEFTESTARRGSDEGSAA